jgi:nitrogenase iron protein NifH
VPRSPVIQACELEGQTVLRHSPRSDEAGVFRELAQRLLDNETRVSPTPIEQVDELEALYRRHLHLRAARLARAVEAT